MTTIDNIDAIPCPQCGRPFGNHTLAEYRDHTRTGLPLEEVDSPFTVDDDAFIADHLDLLVQTVEGTTAAGDTLVLPAIEFRFSSSAGFTMPPIRYVADHPEEWRKLRRLVSAACDQAPMRAQQRQRDIRRNPPTGDHQ